MSDGRGGGVARGAEAEPFLQAVAARQSDRLERLIAAAGAARPAAARGTLFASHAGRALVNAAFDLFECDGLYDLRLDIEHELDRGDPP